MYRGKNISLNVCQHFVGLNSERRGIFLAAVIDCKLAKKNEICSLRGRQKKGGGGGGGGEKSTLTLTYLSNPPPFFPYPFRRMLYRLEICDTPLHAIIYHDLQNF